MKNSSITYSTFNTFKSDSLLFVYMGFLSNIMVINSIDLIERNIVKNEGFKKLRRKLSFLMIESFQNIIRYGDSPKIRKENYLNEMFLVRNIGNHFYIVSVNLIENKKIKYVKSKLDIVNQLSLKELNDLYRKILTNNEFTDAGGAGLGFIEMARKTNQKLEYEFVTIDDDYSYFYLLLKIKENENDIESIHVDINWVKDFHVSASKNEFVVLHKGNISPFVVDPVVSMVEGNLDSKDINIQKLAFHITIEALENVSSLTFKNVNDNDSIFIIGKENQKHFISTGNYIKTKDVQSLEEKLELLKNMNKLEQKQLYEEITHKRFSDNVGKNIGLGLIDIALESNNKFDYNFEKISDDYYFYTFKVDV
ncbi:MAG: SiaB family protein kinase [Bacteroidales bacterium]|nr:SiaB family protein kinase [Bacteroidales bacterium]MBN2757869.1 SiaB family protein kinase [Bacteroidales bacterium]